MKEKLFNIIIISLLFCNVTLAQITKHALLINIGDYPVESGWHKISSVNDTGLIIPALKKHGFQRNNISLLLDSQATKKNITNSLNNLAVNSKAGDIVYIHFSCHGQQIYDKIGDEPDGLDEAMIPFDAFKYYDSTGYTGENHLRDDELGVLVDIVRKSVGPGGDVLVVIDACHSGTATREIGLSRGTHIKFCPPHYQPGTINSQDVFFGEYVESPDLSPFIVISASGASQNNNEYVFQGTSYGSLSFAMSKALSQIDNDVSYYGLFGHVQSTMSFIVPGQSPQVEGDLSRKVFAGETINQEKFHRVKYWRDYSNIVIDAGQLLGLSEGSIVGLYPIGTTSITSEVPVAVGKIIETNLALSFIQLDEKVDRTTAINSWVFVIEKAFSFENVKVKVEGSPESKVFRQVLEVLNEIPFVEIVEKQPDLLLVASESTNQALKVYRSNGQILLNQILKLDDIDVINSTILEYAQANILRSLDVKSSKYDLSFQIIRVDNRGNPKHPNKTERTGLKLSPGDLFKIKIENKGEEDAFYSIIDIQPDNKINLLVPEKDSQGLSLRNPVDCFLKSGETEVINTIFYIAEPYGQEVFKLFASREPLNLEKIHQTRGSFPGISASPFELLFSNSYYPLTRSTTRRLPRDEIGVFTVVFEIVQ